MARSRRLTLGLLDELADVAETRRLTVRDCEGEGWLPAVLEAPGSLKNALFSILRTMLGPRRLLTPLGTVPTETAPCVPGTDNRSKRLRQSRQRFACGQSQTKEQRDAVVQTDLPRLPSDCWAGGDADHGRSRARPARPIHRKRRRHPGTVLFRARSACGRTRRRLRRPG